MLKSEYDFLAWTSFPSSAKLLNDEVGKYAWWSKLPQFSVTPSSRLRISFKAKQENVSSTPASAVELYKLVGGKEVWYTAFGIPLGTFDWRELGRETAAPADANLMELILRGGAGTKEAPGITWIDDLKVYQDGKLIYSDDFSNWAPVIIPAEIITGVAMIKYLK